MKTYLKTVCDILQVDIEKEVYATNLYDYLEYLKRNEIKITKR